MILQTSCTNVLKIATNDLTNLKYTDYFAKSMKHERTIYMSSKKESRLRPAILYQTFIQEQFREKFYTVDMFYETGDLSSWCPQISESPDGNIFQYAIVDSKDKCVGFVSFRIDWYSSCAYNFGLISFDKGNINVGKAMCEVIDMLINEFHLYRIEWRMVGGNPVEKSYDRTCHRYKGTKHVLHDVIRYSDGEFHDSIIYEILIHKNKPITRGTQHEPRR